MLTFSVVAIQVFAVALAGGVAYIAYRSKQEEDREKRERIRHHDKPLDHPN